MKNSTHIAPDIRIFFQISCSIRLLWRSGLRRTTPTLDDAGSRLTQGSFGNFSLILTLFPQTLKACHAHVGSFLKHLTTLIKSLIKIEHFLFSNIWRRLAQGICNFSIEISYFRGKKLHQKAIINIIFTEKKIL